MNDLVMDKYPTVDVDRNKITTEFMINSNEEISISINNSIILDRSDIYDVVNNEITLIDDIDIMHTDVVVVIYNRI